MSTVSVVVAGAAGRMGQAVIRACLTQGGFTLLGGLEAPGHAACGVDLGALTGLPAVGARVEADPLPLIAKADAVIDFTVPAVSVELAALAAQARIVHVCGTTGFAAPEDVRLEAAARHAVLIRSGNMSLGVNVLAGLVRQAARALPDFDIEIVEMHHRQKADAPSGTALLLAEAAAEARGAPLSGLRAPPRDGRQGPRKKGSIGMAAVRGGTIVGEHAVLLAGEGESLVLTHRAGDRAIFAEGALAAARWGQGRSPGLYSMQHVLGFA
jgi:4-hydroxy-tetrahydrodipicolinate reductase